METIMRYLAFAALAALSVGFVDARPASAAHSEYTGSRAACGSTHKAKKTSCRKMAHKKAHHHASKASHKKASRRGGVDRRSAKHHPVASVGSSGGSHGMASYYWQGQMTASGARFNPGAMTAAHRTLPFGTRVLVTNRNNGRSVTVVINDRGPFIKGRIIDLSRGAAGVIGMTQSGVAPVTIAVLGRG